ncbi:hypothetical protein XBFM1_1260036 [Xenorhabdus bovienii str. feltiae Moldova]|uniref:Uncharacterized protein n=1 Tax=Xenorhabdus bovienii str. feltiae Moldova TaxID=1398200 RepID=A0A077NCI9_XENBV|nr:hypothetical protein XBFM1_1260036 [Xenorhabdus bovienii str. feltiae Moldova]
MDYIHFFLIKNHKFLLFYYLLFLFLIKIFDFELNQIFWIIKVIHMRNVKM